MPDLSVLEGAYLRDILDQPRACEDTLANLHVSESLKNVAEGVAGRRLNKIVLTGMGASFHALHPLYLQLMDRGLLALMVETSELVHYQSRLLDPGTLVVAVSQSGRSAEMLRLIELGRRKSTLLAITNTIDSPLAQNVDAVVLTHAGNEFSVSCKTYVTALIALKWLADLLCGRDLNESKRQLGLDSNLIKTYLNAWQEHVPSLLERLAHVEHLFLVGRGASLAAVGTGALIIKESTHFHAEGMSSAAFRHGPFEMLSATTFVLVFEGDPRTHALNRGLLNDIREKGGLAELAGEDASFSPTRLPRSSEGMRPILEILPVQMITLALALRANREPGRFELATKVTTKE